MLNFTIDIEIDVIQKYTPIVHFEQGQNCNTYIRPITSVLYITKINSENDKEIINIHENSLEINLINVKYVINRNNNDLVLSLDPCESLSLVNPKLID